MAYQHQFPEYALLPAIHKSIKGKAESVLRSLGPDFDIDQAIVVLLREYKGVASSNIVFKQFMSCIKNLRRECKYFQ